jgi:hypothetical protein
MLDGEITEPSKPWFEYGERVHMYLLEPEEFDKEYTFLDYTVPKSPQQKLFCEAYANAKKGTDSEKLLTAYRKSYSTKEDDEKVLLKAKTLKKELQQYIKYTKQRHVTKIVPTSQLYKLNESKTKVLEHKKANELLFNELHSAFGNTDKSFIQNEFQINWEWKINEYATLPCKSLIDRLVIDHDKKLVQLIDLKTTSHLSSFKEKFREYKYNRQLAFYWMAIYWYFENELKLNISEYEKETYVVAVASSDLIEVRVYEIMEPSLHDGLQEIDYTLKSLEWHWVEDKWDYPMTYYEGSGIELI